MKPQMLAAAAVLSAFAAQPAHAVNFTEAMNQGRMQAIERHRAEAELQAKQAEFARQDQVRRAAEVERQRESRQVATEVFAERYLAALSSGISHDDAVRFLEPLMVADYGMDRVAIHSLGEQFRANPAYAEVLAPQRTSTVEGGVGRHEGEQWGGAQASGSVGWSEPQPIDNNSSQVAHSPAGANQERLTVPFQDDVAEAFAACAALYSVQSVMERQRYNASDARDIPSLSHDFANGAVVATAAALLVAGEAEQSIMMRAEQMRADKFDDAENLWALYISQQSNDFAEGLRLCNSMLPYQQELIDIMREMYLQ